MKSLLFLLFTPLIVLGQCSFPCPIPEGNSLPTVLNVIGAGAVLKKAFDQPVQVAANAPRQAANDSSRPESVPAEKVAVNVSSTQKQTNGSRLNDLRTQRAAVLEETVEFLKPRPEDYADVDQNDPYVKGWPEIFGPEAKRRERILKAKAFLDIITAEAKGDLVENRIVETEDSVHNVVLRKIDGKGNRDLKKDDGLLDVDLKKANGHADIELLKAKLAAELELKKEELRLKYEMLTKKAALTKEIINAIRADPDIEVDLNDEGTISIRKGRQEQGVMVSPGYGYPSVSVPVPKWNNPAPKSAKEAK